MQTSKGHLTYCTNIHAGESWNDHFSALKECIPAIKQQVSPVGPFGIGLRLSNLASLELRKQEALEAFRQWLDEHNCYVFTMNAFPYGGFHHAVVKDKVHAPDWLSPDRVAYTIRMAQILAALLPEETDGGISTSPLTYRFWHKEEDIPGVLETATFHLLQVVEQLVRIKRATGKFIHIDIEPEPDGLLGNGREFLDWYSRYLLPVGIPFLEEKFGFNEDEAGAALREHIQLCYDICHFAVGYEDHTSMIQHARALGIKIGKIQISAALRADMPSAAVARQPIVEAFARFDEPVYLHQVIAREQGGGLIRYPDMGPALADAQNTAVNEWRAHYHVPIFMKEYGLLQCTRQDIEQVLSIHSVSPITFHLEIETYTWEVLPKDMQLPIAESIVREIQWVINLIEHEPLRTGQANA